MEGKGQQLKIIIKIKRVIRGSLYFTELQIESFQDASNIYREIIANKDDSSHLLQNS